MKKYLLSIMLLISINLFAQKVHISGSDILDDALKSDIEGIAKSSNVEIVSELKGTRDALKKLLSDETDIGIVILKSGEKLPEGYKSIPFADQAVIVIVNSSNEEDDINIDQLGRMYGKLGSAENWSQVGLDKMRSKVAMPVSTSMKDGLIVELFKNICLGGNGLAPSIQFMKDQSSVKNFVKQNSNAIGLIGMIEERSDVKTLAVSSISKGEEMNYSFKPTFDNIYNGDYPLSIKFYLVYNPKNTGKVKRVLSSLLSDETANTLKRNGFYPVPKNFRKSFILNLDISK